MKTIDQLLAMANDSNVHHRTFFAEAKTVLGDGCPNTKDEIVAALKERQTVTAVTVEPKIEVQVLRKYAPMGEYEVMEDGEWYDYAQPVATPENPGVVNMTVAPGKTVRLPKKEASRAIKENIAQVTENTFG